MNRTEKLNRYCIGKVKTYVAEKELRISRQALSYILRIDLDLLISRIDALQLSPAIEASKGRKSRAA